MSPAAAGDIARVLDMPDAPTRRFLTLDEVAEELATSKNQVYALVRQRELGAIKIGGRGQWRVGRDDLEKYIERLYEETRQFIKDHPYDQEAEQDPGLGDSVEPGHEEVTALAAMSNPLPPNAAVGADNSPRATASGSDAHRDDAGPEL